MLDLEIGLSNEDIAVRDTAHKFAEEVLRPAGAELDRMHDPADVIAPESVLWEVFAKYHELGFGGLADDEEMDPVARARLMAIVNEELAWGDVGLAITLGLCGFHGPWVTADRRSRADRALLLAAEAHHRLLGTHRARPRKRHGRAQ